MKKNFFIVSLFLLFVQGAFSQKEKLSSNKLIKIGLLIPNNKNTEAKFGAEMAINEANKRHNKKGLYFQLITRSLKGSWGTGSSKAVDLIFKDHVWAIMGAHGGRNAHLVEQVISKTHVVYLSSWATDPTLSQAFIPWYFSCVPNDNQQVKSLVEEIYKKRKLTKIAVVSSESFDANYTLKIFLKEAKAIGKTEPMQFIYDGTSLNFNSLLTKINKANIQAVVFLDTPLTSLNFKKDIPIFGTLSFFGENAFNTLKLSQYNNVIVVTSGNWLDSKKSIFNIKFYHKFGKNPSAVAAYAYDGMNLLINAIRCSWPNREKVKEELSNIKYNGITGLIQFDDKGNRKKAAGLIKIENGNPIMVEK